MFCLINDAHCAVCQKYTALIQKKLTEKNLNLLSIFTVGEDGQQSG